MDMQEINNLYSESLQQKFPELTKEQLLFIIAVYHPESELNNIAGGIHKKFEAFSKLKFPKEKGRFIDEETLLGDNKTINKCGIRYLKMWHSIEFAEINIYKEQAYEMLELLKNLRPEDATDTDEKKKIEETRAKLLTNIESIKGKIKKLELFILAGDNSRGMLLELYEDLDDGWIPSPEEVTTRLANGQSPLGNEFNAYTV
jgi:hypothetical protein